MATARKVQAVILGRKSATDDSLLLQTLLDSGDFQAFRLPGILKSRRRSAFHYVPGVVCNVIYHPQPANYPVPRHCEPVFSPYKAGQDLKRLEAVAEMIQPAREMKPGEDAAAYFRLLCVFLEAMPQDSEKLQAHLNRFYWELLKLLGFAHEPEGDFAVYDLLHGPLSTRELSMLPDSGLRLPLWWLRTGDGPVPGSTAIREKIRQFLKNL